jgi:uncharacterized integral membrane protein
MAPQGIGEQCRTSRRAASPAVGAGVAGHDPAAVTESVEEGGPMTERSERRPRTHVQYGRLIAVAAVVVLVLIFVFQNTESAEFTFLFWSFSLSLWLMLVLVLAIGIAAGWTLSVSRRRRR